jgi:hypothetical protein
LVKIIKNKNLRNLPFISLGTRTFRAVWIEKLGPCVGGPVCGRAHPKKNLVVAKGFQKVEEEEEEIKGIIITTRMGSMSNGYDNSAEQQHPPPP